MKRILTYDITTKTWYWRGEIDIVESCRCPGCGLAVDWTPSPEEIANNRCAACVSAIGYSS